MIAGLVFWIMKIVEVCQIPDQQYRIAGTDKTVWVLVVILAGWIGALIWQFAKREHVLGAAHLVGAPGFGPVALPGPTAAPPPGWYPEPGTGWFAFGAGRGGPGARQPPQGLPPQGHFSPGFGGQPGYGGQPGHGGQPGYGG